MSGDSVVLVGDAPSFLCHVPAAGCAVRVRNTYLPGLTNTIDYVEGRDYLLDRATGTIRRGPESRIPDFGTNILYGREQFDHSKFPGYGNTAFFAFIDYSFRKNAVWPVEPRQAEFLSSTRRKLARGGKVKIVAYGDSITAGGEATRPDLIFWRRWAEELRRKYPRAKITDINGATGGDTTAQGLQRLQTKVLDEKPDLVLIAFGMNDHNIGSVPVPRFESNLTEMISRIRASTSAEIILLSAFPPNPKWKFGSHHMEDYAVATARVARQNKCAYADVYDNWVSLAERKKPEDLLGNNINHPNDFGHWIYLRALEELGL